MKTVVSAILRRGNEEYTQYGLEVMDLWVRTRIIRRSLIKAIPLKS